MAVIDQMMVLWVCASFGGCRNPKKNSVWNKSSMNCRRMRNRQQPNVCMCVRMYLSVWCKINAFFILLICYM